MRRAEARGRLQGGGRAAEEVRGLRGAGRGLNSRQERNESDCSKYR